MAVARTSEVDTVRGLALFGICVVNVPFLGLPMDSMVAPPVAAHDRIASFLVEMFFQGKFFVLFSFLFGWGFGIQAGSAERAGVTPNARYFRRLAGLLIIGILHATLVFFGDILVLYALLGVLLWFARDLSPAALMRWAGVLVLLAMACLGLLGIALAETPVPTTTGPGYLGTFGEGVAQRILDWTLGFPFILLFNGPIALAAFLGGLAAQKARFFEPGSLHYAALRDRWPWLLGVGLMLNIAYALTASGIIEHGVLALAALMSLAIGGPCLGTIYLIAAIELARRERFQGATVAAGRMSLTSYIGEGVLAGLIFNGYGLGLFGKLGPLALLVVATLIYLAVHAFAAIWLRRFRTGPLEWVLRWITRGTAAAAT